MIALYILLAILLLLLLILLVPIVLWIDLDDTKDRFDWGLSWFGISIFTGGGAGLLQRLSARNQKKPKVKKKPPERKEEEKEEKSKEKPPFSERLSRIWTLIKAIVPSLPTPLRLIWKGFSIHDLVIGIQVGRFDAKDCAVAYGIANTLVYANLGFLESIMRVRVKQVQICCAFGQEKTRRILSGSLHFCLMAAFCALCAFAVGFGIRYLRERENPAREIKPKENRKEFAS